MNANEILKKALEKKNTTPLRFSKRSKRWEWNSMRDSGEYVWRTFDMNDILEKKDSTTEEKVMRLFTLCSSFPTRYVKNNSLQCRAGASRSAFDIWRLHLQYYGEISIQEVMRAIHSLAVDDEELSSQYCCTVHKRVFWLSDEGSLNDEYQKDEFGLEFPDWESLTP